jgi:hypothetical protein
MHSKSIALFFLFTIIFSITINAYRLDGLTHNNDIDDVSELNDPYLIQRLQTLLAAAAASKRGNAVFNDDSHLLDRRLAMNRRPGLLRLK